MEVGAGVRDQRVHSGCCASSLDTKSEAVPELVGASGWGSLALASIHFVVPCPIPYPPTPTSLHPSFLDK